MLYNSSGMLYSHGTIIVVNEDLFNSWMHKFTVGKREPEKYG